MATDTRTIFNTFLKLTFKGIINERTPSNLQTDIKDKKQELTKFT